MKANTNTSCSLPMVPFLHGSISGKWGRGGVAVITGWLHMIKRFGHTGQRYNGKRRCLASPFVHNEQRDPDQQQPSQVLCSQVRENS